MEPIQAVILGVIQGLTEFLPVSSSGHLVIFQYLFGLREAELFFDICVHMGTLAAVIIFFRKEIGSILVSLFNLFKLIKNKEALLAGINSDQDIKMAVLIIIGSVPTAIIGLGFHKIAEQLFSSIFLVGCMLIITGTFLWSSLWVKNDRKNIAEFTIKDALIIGFVQGLAILPGISRSGSTITMGLFLGLNKETSARYSFLLCIPAIIGAQILSIKDLGTEVSFNINVIAGALTAGIVGYFALVLLVFIVNKGRMHLFAPYCWFVGAIALFIGY
ncbi:Undecaprenyl-diphosphatase [Desulfonema limicola]|uniref:Undecaprenyl-diphosphatase n=1 Tax=Desulfonema limicola TaxID=45656 RepID=A0A975B639_9BACT|nr:undecaprenyl-diphosphate phosphatase [Desulfonema limicola]QTA79427.1 Undecaprenyl-diphosphatase [Desulfonema limicola]